MAFYAIVLGHLTFSLLTFSLFHLIIPQSWGELVTRPVPRPLAEIASHLAGGDRGDRDKVGPAPRRPKPNGIFPPTGTRVAGHREALTPGGLQMETSWQREAVCYPPAAVVEASRGRKEPL